MPGAQRPLVIGAGPAGLSAAWALKRAGVEPIVLERADGVCSSWRGYYRALRMNSPRRMSSLPGMPMERSLGRWVARADFVDYVERYAQRVAPDIRFGTEVQRLDRDRDGWHLQTSAGPLHASAVVVASGLNARPNLPDWPGVDSYARALIHAREYSEPDGFAGRDVLVVGTGTSATDIAVELARSGDGRVRMSVRTPPVIYRPLAFVALMSQLVKHAWMPTRFVDRASLLLHDVFCGDLSAYGLERPSEGLVTSFAKRGHGATMDRGLLDAIKRRRIEIVPAVQAFDGTEVVLAGGARISPEAVIAGTGQYPALEQLVGHLDVLRPPVGHPRVHGAKTADTAPQLYFLGFRVPPGQLPDLGIDARAIARRIARTCG